jgi:hypothetical protein
MAIATSTALMLGGMAAQGVAGAVKAKKQSTAAKKAAEEQAKSAQQAQGYTREGLAQMSQLYSPYLNSGAATMMNRLTTPGPGARYASPGAPSTMPPQNMPQPQGQAVPRGGMGMPPPQGGTFAQMMPPQGALPRMRQPPPGQFQY